MSYRRTKAPLKTSGDTPKLFALLLSAFIAFSVREKRVSQKSFSMNQVFHRKQQNKQVSTEV